MLRKFSVSNFKCFKDKFEFDLSSAKNYTFNTDCVKNGIVNCSIVYGYNGSGKSNISDRVAVKRASRARFRQIDVSKTATRLKVHEKPPFVLKYCPRNARKTAIHWRMTALRVVSEA